MKFKAGDKVRVKDDFADERSPLCATLEGENLHR